MHPRFVPSTFDPTDESLTGVALPRSYRWESLTETLSGFGTKVALLRLPLFWQVLPIFRESCLAAGCSLFVNEKENMPLGEAALRVGEVNTVITDTKDAFAFSLFCTEKNTPVPTWIIVHELQGEWSIPVMIDDSARIAQEVHALPGVPILTQCETLRLSRMSHFHTAQGATLKSAEGAADVSHAGAGLNVIRIPVSFRTVGTCACGKETLVRA